MPGISIAGLEDMRREERDPKVKERLLVWTKRKKGMTIRKICEDVGRPYSTIRQWLTRGSVRGIVGRYDEMVPGVPCKLDGGQLSILVDDLVSGPRECGFEHGMWMGSMVAEHIYNRFGVEYSEVGARVLLHRIGFSWKKPRHPDAASKRTVNRFKKKKS